VSSLVCKPGLSEDCCGQGYANPESTGRNKKATFYKLARMGVWQLAQQRICRDGTVQECGCDDTANYFGVLQSEYSRQKSDGLACAAVVCCAPFAKLPWLFGPNTGSTAAAAICARVFVVT
jgi:hypothetical protein